MPATGRWGVYAGCAAGDAVETAKVCAAEILKLAERIEPAELARAKAQLKAHMFMAREQPLSRAEQGAGQVLLFDRLYPPTDLAREVDAVTARRRRASGRPPAGRRPGGHRRTGGQGGVEGREAFERTLFKTA